MLTLLYLIAGWLIAIGVIGSRTLRRAIYWGAFWGVAYGAILVAPRLLSAHHFGTLRPLQWLILQGVLIVLFVVIGATLGFVVAIPVAFQDLRRRGRGMAQGTFASQMPYVALTLPTAYLATSALIERFGFGHLPSLRGTAGTLSVVALVSLIIAGALAIARRRFPDPVSRNRRVAVGIAACAVLALALLPFRVSRPPGAGRSSPPLVRKVGSAPPLLVIGLDGGTWRALRPLMSSGDLPTLAKLVRNGMSGDVKALWPPYWSTPAWGAIVTGHSRADVGLYEDLSASAPGLPSFELPLTLDVSLDPLFVLEYALIRFQIVKPMFTPRTRLGVAPVWERLSHAGVKTAVIRFPFTYPAKGQADVVVSNQVVVDLWDMLGVQPGEYSKLVEPESMTPAVLARFDGSHDVSASLTRQVLPNYDGVPPPGVLVDPVSILGRVLNVDHHASALTASVVRTEPDLKVVMLYVTALDNISHPFWPYAFPEDFSDAPPSARDVKQLGPVIGRYLRLFDAELKEVIDAFLTEPNVLVVSDHGEGRSRFSTIWPGWHDSPGIFIAAGPSIPHDSQTLDVSYYDIVPTILDLEHIELPSDLHGRSLLRDPRAADVP